MLGIFHIEVEVKLLKAWKLVVNKETVHGAPMHSWSNMDFGFCHINVMLEEM